MVTQCLYIWTLSSAQWKHALEMVLSRCLLCFSSICLPSFFVVDHCLTHMLGIQKDVFYLGWEIPLFWKISNHCIRPSFVLGVMFLISLATCRAYGHRWGVIASGHWCIACRNMVLVFSNKSHILSLPCHFGDGHSLHNGWWLVFVPLHHPRNNYLQIICRLCDIFALPLLDSTCSVQKLSCSWVFPCLNCLVADIHIINCFNGLHTLTPPCTFCLWVFFLFVLWILLWRIQSFICRFLLALFIHGFWWVCWMHMLGKWMISFIWNPLGILPHAAISFSLVKARWFNLMCHFNMFLLMSLVLSSSSCLGSTLVDVSKLYGVMGSILFLPSFISVGCLCLSLQIQVFVTKFIVWRYFPNLVSCFQLLMNLQLFSF